MVNDYHIIDLTVSVHYPPRPVIGGRSRSRPHLVTAVQTSVDTHAFTDSELDAGDIFSHMESLTPGNVFPPGVIPTVQNLVPERAGERNGLRSHLTIIHGEGHFKHKV